MMRIVAIEDNAPLEGRGASAANLPETGDPGTTCIVGIDGVGVSAEFLFGDWPRPDDAHVSLKDIEELWKLVQAGFPQNRTDHGDPWIVAQLPRRNPLCGGRRIRFEMPAQAFRCIDRHGPEFEALEPPSLEPDARVAE